MIKVTTTRLIQTTRVTTSKKNSNIKKTTIIAMTIMIRRLRRRLRPRIIMTTRLVRRTTNIIVRKRGTNRTIFIRTIGRIKRRKIMMRINSKDNKDKVEPRAAAASRMEEFLLLLLLHLHLHHLLSLLLLLLILVLVFVSPPPPPPPGSQSGPHAGAQDLPDLAFHPWGAAGSSAHQATHVAPWRFGALGWGPGCSFRQPDPSRGQKRLCLASEFLLRCFVRIKHICIYVHQHAIKEIDKHVYTCIHICIYIQMYIYAIYTYHECHLIAAAALFFFFLGGGGVGPSEH